MYLGNLHQGSSWKGASQMGEVGEATESRTRTKQEALFPLRSLIHIQHHNSAKWSACPGEYLRPRPLQHNRYAYKLRRQRTIAQMKEQINTPEKELSNKKITNLSDAGLKTLVDQDAQRND